MNLISCPCVEIDRVVKMLPGRRQVWVYQHSHYCGFSTRWSIACRQGTPLSSSWWRHQMETFSALLAICAGISPGPVNSPHKGQWHGASRFSLICVWINGWVNNREAGDLRRHRSHYDVIVMINSPHADITSLSRHITCGISSHTVDNTVKCCFDAVFYAVLSIFSKIFTTDTL